MVAWSRSADPCEAPVRRVLDNGLFTAKDASRARRMEQTLLLNATYEPMQVISWRRAIRMHFQDKVEVVEVYPRQIRSMRLALPMPSVIPRTD